MSLDITSIDWKNPNYTDVLLERSRILALLRSDPKYLQAAMVNYKLKPWDFINDWGMTFEPRNIERDLPATIPFVLFPRQLEFLKWLHERWQSGERGLVEKSRDFGATWLAGAYAATMWLFHDGFTAGVGSRKEDLVDKRGDPKSIFEKIRFFVRYLPDEFKPNGWDERKYTSFLKITNPNNGATITGEAGDNIGRGARMSLYLVDEAAFIERQESVDAALSQTTNCQIDISTPNGNGNLFYKKAHKQSMPKFIMDWKDDPRKDEEWYAKQKREQDAVTVAQEIDRDYNASVEGIFIPSRWVVAAIDAHIKLGFEPVGIRVMAFDPADVGDAKALVGRHGSVVNFAEQKKDGDITHAIPWAFDATEEYRADALVFDADGMGAPTIKLGLEQRSVKTDVVAYYGSGAVENPEQKYKELKLNKERFKNRRAQAWTILRDRFENTYNAVVNGKYIDPELMISISSEIQDIHQLTAELSRPLRKHTPNGMVLVESKKDMKSRGVDSPNLADALVQAFSVNEVNEEWAPLDYPRMSIL